MGIELRKVRFYEKLSEETNFFTAELWVNDMLTAHVKNDGQGGSTMITPTKKGKANVELAEGYCKLLPAKNYGGVVIAMDLENYVDDLFDDYIKSLELKKTIKTLDRHTDTKIVVMDKSVRDAIKAGTPFGQIKYSFYNFKNPLIDFNPDKFKAHLDTIKKKLLPGQVIYNDLSFIDEIYWPVVELDLKADWKFLSGQVEKNLAHLNSIDHRARVKGQLLYRYFTVGVADGTAYYQVIAIKGNKARVVLCEGVCPDNYFDQILGGDSWIPLKNVEAKITGKDKISRLFSAQSKP